MSPMPPLVAAPSPNHGPRIDRQGRPVPVSLLMLHYTDMRCAADALDRLRHPEAQVSAHYLIDEDGTVFQLVEDGRRAWHAGRAAWADVADVNSASIGIELQNPGHSNGYRPFAPALMAALVPLARALMRRHGLGPHGVVAHSDVAPTRKQDPGHLFDWASLARAGIGWWPASDAGAPPPPPDQAPALLHACGYRWEDGDWRPALVAFQRRYRPSRFDGEPDPETLSLLARLASAREVA